ncbi:MAG TPA: AMP-binding protein [Myxococcota bacterium]|nr:AMP-binding protein [Myxococcota bacterium]HRY92838.1 AMP-binding protein [Myxococcota bacterium]HSA20283.1 AMP-binding protein [Myxococcota bacterium]
MERRAFTHCGVSLGQVHALAGRLRAELGSAAGPVCLASQDRPVVAAALLCALAGGPPLVLPHALSARVLAEAREATGCGLALVAGDEVELPDGVQAVPAALGPEPPADTPAPARARAEDEVFLSLFTGGSTGRPRLWPKSPRALLGEAAALVRRFGFGPADLVLATVSPLHIYGLLFSVLAPLLSGARVLRPTAFLPAEIERLLGEPGPSLLVGAPAHYRALQAARPRGPRLRLAFSSGGMLDPADGDHFSRASGVSVVEVYGSTETGGVATRDRLRGEQDWTPAEGVRLGFADERLAVDSPFLSPGLPRQADGLFLTGDRAAPAPGGRFALLGRVDGIVKVAGKRVDLAEVEQKLGALPGVREAAVLAAEATGGREHEILALYAGTAEPEAVRAMLAQRVEPQALPRRILRVDAIPLTPSGKRDRRALETLLKG